MSVPAVDTQALIGRLKSIGLEDWANVLPGMIAERMSADAHGDFTTWQQALKGVATGDPDALRAHLLALSPWRKGPFTLQHVEIDAEWRSDWKWQRLNDSIASLQGRRVLDVGCGNGFYALQMAASGADCVIGIDPTVLYNMQFLAANHFARRDNVFVVPARLEELPQPARCFDTTFSMGVLYHRRSPIEHLRELHGTLRRDGQLVLETLYIPGDESYACTPAKRYARMRNVWLLPTLSELETWLRRTGFKHISIVDRSVTTTDEQRTTEWMPFESLAEALDPSNPRRTVEGWPAPRRVILTASS